MQKLRLANSWEGVKLVLPFLGVLFQDDGSLIIQTRSKVSDGACAVFFNKNEIEKAVAFLVKVRGGNSTSALFLEASNAVDWVKYDLDSSFALCGKDMLVSRCLFFIRGGGVPRPLLRSVLAFSKELLGAGFSQ